MLRKDQGDVTVYRHRGSINDPPTRLEEQLLAACREFALVEELTLQDAIHEARLMLDVLESRDPLDCQRKE